MPPFAPAHRCISVDLERYGQSDKTRGDYDRALRHGRDEQHLDHFNPVFAPQDELYPGLNRAVDRTTHEASKCVDCPVTILHGAESRSQPREFYAVRFTLVRTGAGGLSAQPDTGASLSLSCAQLAGGALPTSQPRVGKELSGEFPTSGNLPNISADAASLLPGFRGATSPLQIHLGPVASRNATECLSKLSKRI